MFFTMPPLGVARMTKGGPFGPLQNARPAGHFQRLVYDGRYLNTRANFLIFGLGRPTLGIDTEKNETTAHAGPPKPTRRTRTSTKHGGQTEPPHAKDTKKPTPNTNRNQHQTRWINETAADAKPHAGRSKRGGKTKPPHTPTPNANRTKHVG